jgi:cell division control protein 45
LDTEKQFDLILRGIELAKEMQQAIVRVGTSLIERKEIKMSRYFRYVMIENDFLADVKLFQFPLSLQKLGLFIMEAYQAEKQNSASKPLIISVKNS